MSKSTKIDIQIPAGEEAEIKRMQNDFRIIYMQEERYFWPSQEENIVRVSEEKENQRRKSWRVWLNFHFPSLFPNQTQKEIFR